VLQKKDPSFWVFIASSLLVCIPLSFYYAYCNNFLVEVGAGLDLFGRHFEATAIQTLGQASEAMLMLALPYLLVRLGIKVVLIVGMLAWSLRYVLFAFGYDAGGPVMSLLLIGIVLHGVCYDFFFVASQIYMDQLFDATARARAQSFLTMVTLGVGMLVGGNIGGLVYQANTASSSRHDWTAIWLVPAGLALVVAVGFAFLFRPLTRTADRALH
jgi:MFS family permease